MFRFKRKNKSCSFRIKFVFWAELLGICTLSQTYSKMGLHIQMFLFALLNADSNRATWIKCMTIRFHLQTGDLISFNKHVISGAENEHRAVVRIWKVKNRGILVCFFFSLQLWLPHSWKKRILDRYEVKSTDMTGRNFDPWRYNGMLGLFQHSLFFD